MRAWQAWKSTAIPTPDGPIPVEKGNVVVVLVVPSWAEAFGSLLHIVQSAIPSAGRGDER